MSKLFQSRAEVHRQSVNIPTSKGDIALRSFKPNPVGWSEPNIISVMFYSVFGRRRI